MVVNTNITAQGAARLLGDASQRLAQSLARLSSGSKIVSPEDDAAGLAVSMRFQAQINRTSASMHNLGNAISFNQTQDGYMQKIGAALDRMSELAILAQDVTKTDNDRGLCNQEFQTLAGYVTDVVAKDFNGVSLFSGNALNVTSNADGGTVETQGIEGNYLAGATQPGAAVPVSGSSTMAELFPGFTSAHFAAVTTGHTTVGWAVADTSTVSDLAFRLNYVLSQAGNGSATYDEQTGQFSVTLDAGQALVSDSDDFGNPDDILADLGFSPAELDNSGGSSPKTVSVMLTTSGPDVPVGTSDISTLEGAKDALTAIKSAITQLAADRATVGANIARLSLTAEQLGTLKDNLTAANSRIKDVDVAQESTEFARYNILVQAGTAMLSQANTVPQSVLRLLG